METHIVPIKGARVMKRNVSSINANLKEVD